MIKKITAAAIATTLSANVLATDITVSAAADFSEEPNRGALGLAVSESFGPFSIAAGVEQYIKDEDQTKYTLTAGLDVAKIYDATVTIKAGGAYMDNDVSEDGTAYTLGVGTTIPLVDNFSFVADYRYQNGQDRVSQFDGNTTSVGIKYSF